MKKHSCGAILYTIHNNNIYVILGLEDGKWFPFKGVREHGETNTQAAIREINEETCKEVALFIDRLPTEFQIITFRGITLKHKTKWAEKLRQDWVNKNFDKIM